MVQLSVIIIAFNEEKNIGRCLDSVWGVADEILVVDSFSTDRTEEIVKTKGAIFIQHKFEGHIEQKNFAMTQSKFPFILSIDADEALSDVLKNSIIEVKNNWVCDGYSMNRLTNYCGKWIRYCGWYPDRKLRLIDSRKGKWGGVNPHDKFEIFDKNTSICFLKGDLLHYSYYTREDHYKQVDYFTNIASKELFKQHKKVSVFKIYLSPVIKFLRDYIFKIGILDGYAGFTISRISAYATFLKYKKLHSLWQKNNQ